MGHSLCRLNMNLYVYIVIDIGHTICALTPVGVRIQPFKSYNVNINENTELIIALHLFFQQWIFLLSYSLSYFFFFLFSSALLSQWTEKEPEFIIAAVSDHKSIHVYFKCSLTGINIYKNKIRKSVF